MYVYHNLYPFVQFKFSVYGHMYWTYTRILQCSHASVGLTQARPNYKLDNFKICMHTFDVYCRATLTVSRLKLGTW